MKKRGKSGKILMENIIFIILNLVFLMILILFLLKQGQGAIVLEQTYAKQIALFIDSAKPGMVITLNMEKGIKLAEKEGLDFDEVVKINNNIVMVRLSPKGGYSYSFFNDVNVSAYPEDSDPEKIKDYVFVINKYN